MLNWMYELDVFVTARAWSGDEPTRVGEDMEGALWLEGRLWWAELSDVWLGWLTFAQNRSSTKARAFSCCHSSRPRVATWAGSDCPELKAQVLVAGESDHPIAKVHSLAAMTAAAGGELLVVSDSDIRANPSLLWDLARDFEDPNVG